MYEIHFKKDILIPFTQIGETNWTTNTKIILRSIEEIWDKPTIEVKTPEQIKNLEKSIGTTLPNGLKLFYQTFGLADIGEELQSFEEIKCITDIWKDVPEYAPNFNDEDQKLLPFLITFSDYLGNGNMFCFHSSTKEIYYYDHDDGASLTKLFDRADDYLKGCLILAQSELFAETIDQEEVEEWVEEVVIEMFGEEIYRKWRY